MKFDLSWLCELVDTVPDDDTLAERLTACGFLVETRETVGDTEVWDVEVTTNRPDAMNHRGLARETAVATGSMLRPLTIDLDESDESAAEQATVAILEPELCSRYVARIVRGVHIVESPDWLKIRLEACGVRPVNAVVDATNYLLLELGQPMHAFDVSRLADRSIVVRRAVAGERLTTLDGESRQLDEEMLVIADARQAVALAGIMGGADSEIGPETTDILIESAHFDALSVRRTARKLGMHTEASHRFERGADPEMAGPACDAAAALITRLCGGRVCRGRIDVNPRPWIAKTMEMSVTALSRFAGMDVDPEEVTRILAGLEFEPMREGDRITVTPPSFRVDVERVPDLYEEAIRHIGYARVPSRLPVLPTPPGQRHPNWMLVDRSREAAISVGLVEVVTFSFINGGDDGLVADLVLCPGEPLPLENPLAQTQSTMRRSLLPGLAVAARDNLNRGERSLAIFEQGRVFATTNGSPSERERLAVVLSGSTVDGRAVDFRDLKGVAEEILDRIGFSPCRWRRGGGPWLDEAEGAVVMDGDRAIGVAGLLSRAHADRWNLKQPVYVAELDLHAAAARPEIRFDELPRFPTVTVDMTVDHTADLLYAQLVDTVGELASDVVESMELVVRYAGKGLPDGRVRTTIRLVYRHPERSLTQDEVNQDQARLRDALGERLGVTFS